MFRLTSFLKRSASSDRSGFVQNWQQSVAPVLLHHPALEGRLRRHVLNLPMDPVPLDHLWIVNDEFDAVVELWFDTLDDAVSAANRLADDRMLAAAALPLLDADGCASWIGRVETDFDSADVVIKRIVAGQKAPHLTLEKAQSYWLTGHSEFFKSFTEFMSYMRRYATVTGIPTPGLRLRSYRFFAMCADVGFETVEDLADAYAEPRMATAGPEDLAKFGADTGAILFTAARELVLFDVTDAARVPA